MESCDFREDVGEGEIGSTVRCARKYDTKEVDFRHPDYKELSIRIFLCVHHFDVVFGEMFVFEDRMLRNVKNAAKRYRDDFSFTKSQVRDGVGDDYFDWQLWKTQHYRLVDNAKSYLRNVRRSICRLEYCNTRIEFKRIYSVRVFRRNVFDYVNLNFCCHKHWDSIKLRIGITKTKETKPSITMDKFSF